MAKKTRLVLSWLLCIPRFPSICKGELEETVPMPSPVKIAAIAAVPVLCLGLLWALWPSAVEDPVSAMPAEAAQEAGASPTEPAPAILSFARPGRGPLEVFGPCYRVTRGNDALLPSLPEAQTDCFAMFEGGMDLIDFSNRPAEEPVYIRIAGKPQSRHSITLPPGDNVVEIDGTFDVLLTGTLGTSTVLALPGISTIDMTMRQEGSDVVIQTIQGRVRLIDQTGGTGEEGFISQILLRGGAIVERAQIRVQSVVAQGTPNDDIIRDTDSDDVIYPGLGNDRITLLGGENRVHYEGGDDSITSAGDREALNRLYIPFNRAEASVFPSEDGRDVLVETPVGTVKLELQLFYPLGDPSVPIQEVNFLDGPVDEEGIRFLAETYRDSQNEQAVGERSRLRD